MHWSSNSVSVPRHSKLIAWRGDATDAYAHSPAPNDTYLSIDDAYSEWYKDKYDKEISKRVVIPLCDIQSHH